MITIAAVKFLVGFIAGLCSALFPRLVPAMTRLGESDNVSVLPWDYVLVSLLFAVLIGLVVMIFEWGVVKKPRDTFMAALGIPALLTGALNTADATNKLTAINDQLTAVTAQLSEEAEIPIISAPSAILPITSEVGDVSGGVFGLYLLPITPAYAADEDLYSPAQKGFDPRIQIRQPRFVIVIDRAETPDKAVERAKELRESGLVPEARAVRSGEEFFIIQGGAPRTKADALLEAIDLKTRGTLKPSLLQVGPGPRE